MNTTLAPTLALVLSGCLAFEQDPTLDRFEDCDAVRSYMVDMAMKEVRYEDQFDWSLGSPFMVSYEMSMDDSGAVDVQEDDRGADSYSTTNLQEASVDEADLIKTDGEYVYAVTADHLVVARAWPIDQAEALSSTPIDGSVFGIYLYDDVVVAVSAVVQPSPRAGGTVDEADLDSGAVGVTVIDVADPADPQVVRESYVSGVLRDTRRIGDLLYVVAYVDISVWRGAEDLGEAKERIRQADIARWMR